MKKYLKLLSFGLLVFTIIILCASLIGCGEDAKKTDSTVQQSDTATRSEEETSNTSNHMTLEDLESKYKRAKYDEFINDPSSFIADYNSIDMSYINDDPEYFSSWDIVENPDYYNDDDHVYSKDVVLFNQSAKFTVGVYWDSTISDTISFSIGNELDDFELAKSLANSMFDKYENAENIRIGSAFDEASESGLRKIFNGDSPELFFITFKNNTIYYYYLGYDSYVEITKNIPYIDR